jgi:hypothetical protein
MIVGIDVDEGTASDLPPPLRTSSLRKENSPDPDPLSEGLNM